MTTPREDWWLIVKHSGAVNCWQLGDTTAERREDLIVRARTLVGFPPDDRWVDAEVRCDEVKQVLGEPHQTLLVGAVMHELSDLDRVPSDQVAAYRAASAAARSAARMEAARTTMRALTAEERTQVINDPPPRGTAGGSRV